MNSLIDFAVSLLFVHKCFLCGRVLSGNAYLCKDCALPAVGEGELCPRCGKRLEECLCERLPENRCDLAAAPLYYTGGVPYGIHKFKYENRRYYADFLTPLLYAELMRSWPDLRFDLVTCVPMHPKKRRSRGYCQGELLAKGVAKALDLPFSDKMLYNTGKGRPQMEQRSFQAREQNARRSYEARRGAEEIAGGRTVLLVDDVLTTGWTAARCGMLLHELGAEKVCLLAAATTRKN